MFGILKVCSLILHSTVYQTIHNYTKTQRISQEIGNTLFFPDRTLFPTVPATQYLSERKTGLYKDHQLEVHTRKNDNKHK